MWMDLEDIMLSEIGQTQKNKYRMTSLTYGIQKEKKKTTTKFTHIQSRNRLVVARGQSLRGGWEKWVKGVERYKISKPCM